MKNIKKITGLALSLSLVLSPVSVFASQKTESVYTKLDSNGQKQEITVTNHLYYNGCLFLLKYGWNMSIIL